MPGYGSPVAEVAGFEPTHTGVKVPCLTAWLRPITMTEPPMNFFRKSGVSSGARTHDLQGHNLAL